MEVRKAAKGLISCDDYSKYLFVAGKRGMWTLPGGGIDADETPKEAFLREADEEVDMLSSYISSPQEAYSLKGPVTTSEGVRRIAHWFIYRANLMIPSSELTIPADSEITALAAFSAEECVTNDNMSILAKYAILNSNCTIGS